MPPCFDQLRRACPHETLQRFEARVSQSSQHGGVEHFAAGPFEHPTIDGRHVELPAASGGHEIRDFADSDELLAIENGLIHR